ncbi:uncharacterized protein LOC142344056 [Convolutriloba macropyga]|uniref:uncharacterized protein LOC142344056 n=1 Tax=Convolutriloba macropyga TaxID=536237 RepID=UPI003F5258F2
MDNTTSFIILACIVASVDTRLSQDFILPNQHSYWGQKCAKLSKYFCLLRLQFDAPVSNRMSGLYDVIEFQSIVRPIHRLYNWFSLYQFGFGGCCNMQTENFLIHRRRWGVTPEEFYRNITDFSSSSSSPVWNGQHKQLIRIHAEFIKALCINEILELSFGYGDFQLTGNFNLGADFVFPPLGKEGIIYRFKSQNIKQELTFDRFKSKIVCKEQPWICKIGHELNKTKTKN